MFFKSDPISTVETALNERGVKFGRITRDVIVTGFRADGDYDLFVTIRRDSERKTVLFLVNPVMKLEQAFATIAQGAPPVLRVHEKAGHSPDQVARVCELLMKENYNIVLGGYERDPSDGEIRFKIAFPYRDGSVTKEQAAWCFDLGLSTVSLLLREKGSELKPGEALGV